MPRRAVWPPLGRTLEHVSLQFHANGFGRLIRPFKYTSVHTFHTPAVAREWPLVVEIYESMAGQNRSRYRFSRLRERFQSPTVKVGAIF
jgi:hypothetical protein